MVFHGLAGSFLAAHRFVLTNDPGIMGRYGGSSACYRSNRGLSLWVIFDHVDSDHAWIDCGREWAPKGAASFLSNGYSRLAQRFGLDVPLTYPMDRREPLDVLAKKILNDLKRSLPIVASKVAMSDLLAIENEEPRGAAVNVTRGYGADYTATVHISDFSEN
jgi:hypothetical protein